jgi:hypothetical protein
MTEKQFLKTKLSNVMSYNAVLWLMKFRDAKQGAIPENWRVPITQSYTVAPGRFANSKLLEKIILDVLKAYGYKAHKPNDKAKKVMQKGREVWVKGGGVQVGAADIQAIGHGRLINFEVKYRNDRQRDEQKEFEKHIKESGFEYYIIKSIDQFLDVMKIDRAADIELAPKKALDTFWHREDAEGNLF